MIIVPGTTSFIIHVFIQDSTVTTGAGKTALAFGDITAYYVLAGGTLTALTMVDITTLGTWDADVISDKLGFKLLHDTNAPGLYEVHLPNNIIASAGFCAIQLRATGAAPCNIRIQLANVPGNVQTIAAGAITAAAIATDAIDADSLKADAVTEIVAGILAGVVEGTLSIKHALQSIHAACAGKSAGGGTVTLTFRDAADTKDRITATVDATGNRDVMVFSYD